MQTHSLKRLSVDSTGKRWSAAQNAEAEDPAVDAFLADLAEVCKRHGLSLAHEDSHGAFIARPFNDADAKWLSEAHIGEARS